jgi:DNA-binding CsgD family transcriptional regulator
MTPMLLHSITSNDVSDRFAANTDARSEPTMNHDASAVRSDDVRAVHSLIARGDLVALRVRVSASSVQTLPRYMLDAAIALYEGRMDRSRRCFDQALRAASQRDLPYVFDLLAPLLILDGSLERYESLRNSIHADDYLAGAFAATDSIAAARRGDRAASIIAAETALDLNANCDDEVLGGRILLRLAYAALQRRDFAAAATLAERSARTLQLGGAHRAAATAYSIAYNVHHAGTGDFERAEIHAAKLVAAARRSADVALENLGLVAQYEMACEAGDDVAAAALRRRIDLLALPEQYGERFARGVSDALLAAFRDDAAAFHVNAALLRDVLAPDRPGMALASALQSLSAAALGDFEEARRRSRAALGLASLGDPSEPAYSMRHRVLARALAASTCVLIGDNVRAERATTRRSADDKCGMLAIVSVARGADFTKLPKRIRGYGRVVAMVRREIDRSFRSSLLSESEYGVLVLLADGLSAPQVAERTGRSVHTIRAHTRSIIAKFGVSGRPAAIAFAQARGLLFRGEPSGIAFSQF